MMIGYTSMKLDKMKKKIKRFKMKKIKNMIISLFIKIKNFMKMILEDFKKNIYRNFQSLFKLTNHMMEK